MKSPFMQNRGGHEISADDRPIEEAPELSEEDKYELQKRMEAMDKLLASQKKAKYKIELLFGKARSMNLPIPGAISFWESGTKLHGGGDAKVYFCPGRLLKKNDCQTLIPFAFNAYGHQVCPGCHTTWKDEQVIGEIFGRHTMRGWSELIYQYFTRLEHNCDIYLKHAQTDIRSIAAAEQEKQQHGDMLNKARSKRALHIYRLQNIIKDTSAGADLLNRFYAFLTS